MFKKTMTIYLAVLLILGLISGCAKTPATSSEVTKAPIQITFGVYNQTSEMAIAKAFVEGYKKINANVTVKIIGFSGDYNEAILKLVSSNTMPDVSFTLDDKIDYFANKKVFLPMDEYFKKSGLNEADYFESIMEIARPLEDGLLYFVPRDYNKIVTFINKDMFEAAGLAIPSDSEWTWEKYKEYCSILKSKMQSNTSPEKGLVETSIPSDPQFGFRAVYNAIVESFGGQLFKNGEPDFLNANTQKAMEEMKNFIDSGLGISPAAAGTSLFLGNQAAMLFGPRPNLSNAIKAGINVDFLPFPIIGANSKVGLGTTGYALTNPLYKADKSQERVDAGWEFCKYIISEAGQNDFSLTGDCVPVLKSLANDENAQWRKFSSDKLNHNAFVSNSQYDLKAPFLQGYTPDKQRDLYLKFDELFVLLFNSYGNLDSASKFGDYANKQITFLK